MSLQAFITLSTRVIITWLVLSLLILFIGEYIISLLIPFIAYVTNLLSSNFDCVVSIVNTQESTIIQCAATLSKDIYIESIPTAPAGYKLTSHTNLIHALVPIVILYTALLSWPQVSIKEKLLLCMLGIIGVLVITVTVVPTLLIGNVEAQLISAAERQAGSSFAKPLVMKLVVFFETGGRWLYPIIFALLCKQISNIYFKTKN